MRVTRTTRYSIDVGDHVLDVPHEPAEWIDPHVSIEGDTLTLRYAVVDQDADDPLVEAPGVHLRLFHSGAERDEWLDDNELGPRQLLVERYEHGLVRYSVLDTGIYPDRRWDVARGVGVLTLDEDWDGDLVAIANALLDEYSAWCNGDAYGVVEVTYRLVDGAMVMVSNDALWGYVGAAHAQQVVGEGF